MCRAIGHVPLPVPQEFAPVFVIGCGRSGTTITTEVLGRHPAIEALNEPRYLWSAIEPATDVWDRESQARRGRLVFDRADACAKVTRTARRLFYLRKLVSRRAALIEKLPVNSFRLEWIAALFPTASFINVVRHPLAVAASIAQLSPGWFGHDDWRWRQLCSLAEADGFPSTMLEVGDDHAARGVLEWTLSVERSESFFSALAPDRVLRLHYENLLAAPMAQLERVLLFLGLSSDQVTVAEMATPITPRPRRGSDRAVARLQPRTVALLRALGYQEESDTPVLR